MQNNVVKLVWVCFIVCSEGHKIAIKFIKK